MTAPRRLTVGAAALAAEWILEIEHRADAPALVHNAIFGSNGADDGASSPPSRAPLDPLSDRPLLDDDSDAAVIIDACLAALAVEPLVYRSAGGITALDSRAAALTDSERLTIVRRFLDRETIYATPECRVSLEGRARYNLAFEAARLRGTGNDAPHAEAPCIESAL